MTGRWCDRVESSWYLPRVGEDRESRESVRDSRNGEGGDTAPYESAMSRQYREGKGGDSLPYVHMYCMYVYIVGVCKNSLN